MRGREVREVEGSFKPLLLAQATSIYITTYKHTV